MFLRHLMLLALVIALLAINQPAVAQITTNNAQSACVQFGDCSTAQGTQKTETQNAPVTAPSGTPALAGYTTLDPAYISSLAAAGASAAYTGGSRAGGGGGAASTSTAGRASSAATAGGASNTGGSGGLSGLGSSSGNGAMTTSTAVMLNSAVLLAGTLIGAVLLL